MRTDLWGTALLDYYQGIPQNPLILHTSFGPPENVPLDVFFRTKDSFSDLEVFALDLCQDTILDIGAGTGCHAYFLQHKGHVVTALEKSPGACEVIKMHGINNVVEQDIFQYKEDGFHTALMMMNGLGLAGTLENLPKLLHQVFSRLSPDGQIIADSSDIAYLYEDRTMPEKIYYGELEYCYEYQGERDVTFPWLFVDIHRLKHAAAKVGLKVQMVFEEQDQYLVRITRT